MTENTNAITFQDYVLKVNQEFVMHHAHQRMGQVYFNVLDDVRPFLAYRVRTDNFLDPFYKDKNIPAFLEFVARNWDTDFEVIFSEIAND